MGSARGSCLADGGVAVYEAVLRPWLAYARLRRVKAEGGYVLLVRLEGDDYLAATTGPEARVGLALYEGLSRVNALRGCSPATGGTR